MLVRHWLRFSWLSSDQEPIDSQNKVRISSPFQSQNLIGNSPYCLLYNSYDVGSENLVFIKLIIPLLIFFCIFIISLVCLILSWYCEKKVCISHSWELSVTHAASLIILEHFSSNEWLDQENLKGVLLISNSSCTKLIIISEDS